MVKELVEHGVKYLAVPIGGTAKGTALTRILALKSSPGWIAGRGSVREWRFEGLMEKDGSALLYGPHLAGISLGAVLELPLPKALPYLSLLVGALGLLSERSVPWFALQSDAVLFAESGEVLFLPPDITREIRDLSTFALNRDTYESINHPDLKGEARASFSVASLLYRVITGRFPFTGNDAEELHEQARKLDFDAPAGIVPELAQEVSTLVMAGLGRSRRPAVSLAEWAERLETWQKQALFRVLAPEEKEKSRREAGTRRQTSEKSFRRRMFWEKNWKIIGIVAFVVVATAAGIGSIVRNVLAPRVTHGYPPLKVVETFYTSMNSLDHQAMQACVIGKAGAGEINEVTMLYVTSRVTQGYQGKSTIISAEDWNKGGRPDIESPSTLYGVTGLSIMQEQGEPSPVFKVQYDKWNPASAPDTGNAPRMDVAPKSEGNRIVERVWLKQDKGDWVIYKIDRLRQDLLPPPAVASPSPPGSSPP
jgi:hypothetical protein